MDMVMPYVDPALLYNPQRIELLRRLSLLDPTGDPAFDRLTHLTARILKTPISLISLLDIDRQIMKGQFGWGTKRESPFSHSFCKHVVASGEMLVVDDSLLHELVRDNAAVIEDNVAAYLGAPLIMSGGEVVGALCVIDHAARYWTQEEIELLTDLSKAVITEIELRNQLYEKELTRAQLKTSEDRYRLISESTSDYAFSCIVLPDGGYIHNWFTDSFQKITGYAPQEIIEMPRFQMYHPDDMWLARQQVEQVLQGIANQGEYRIITKAGEVRQVLMYRQPTYDDASGRVTGFYGIAQDITERKNAEREHVESERLRMALEKEREMGDVRRGLMTMVSHEFRTPLATIQSSSEMLKRYYDRMPQDRRLEKLDDINHQVLRLTEMVDDIQIMVQFQYGRLHPQPEPVKLDQLSTGVIELFQQRQQPARRIRLQTSGDLQKVLIDPRLFARILSNLITNGLRYSPDDQPVLVDLHGDSNRVTLRVTDHGIGIPADEQARIYEPFFRGRNTDNIAGTGLGLSIVKECVQLAHGTIDLTSGAEFGTTFTIQLPVIPHEESFS
jgi:PAS domain S-box-containing protein